MSHTGVETPIIFVMGALPPRTGGEWYDFRIQRHLQTFGHRVGHVDGSLWPRPTGSSLQSRWRRLRFALALVRAHGREHGLFIEDEYFARDLFATNFARRLLRRGRLVIIVHHLENTARERPWTPLGKLRRRAYLAIADRVITVSDYSRRELESLGVRQSRVSIVVNGFDPFPLPSPAAVKREPFQLLCVGRCEPRKGLEHLLSAVALLPPGGVHVTVAGDNHTDHFHQVIGPLTQRLGIATSVDFRGFLPAEQLHELYASADAFVLPSLVEGFGVVLLEAMHSGTPVIASRAGGIPEVVSDGHNGLLVPPANPTALAAAINRLRLDPVQRRLLAKEGRRTVSSWPSWRTSASAFRSVLDELQ